MTALMRLVDGPVTFTTPSSGTRFYTTSVLATAGGSVNFLLAYMDPDQSNTTVQPQTCQASAVRSIFIRFSRTSTSRPIPWRHGDSLIYLKLFRLHARGKIEPGFFAPGIDS